MKAKKPLVVVVVALALLAVALILPAAASGKPDLDKPVSWVSVGTNCWLPDGFHGGTEAKVEKFADGTLSGKVIVKVLREFYPPDPTPFHYVVKTSDFTSPDWWDYAPPGLAYSDFFYATAGNWPADLGGASSAPEWWFDYEGAAVADFVAYVPVSEYPESLPWLVFFRPPFTDPFPAAPSIPLRFMFIDSGKSGRADVMLNWLFVGSWMDTVWTVPIQAGNIQVHVGAMAPTS
jgi:hypothetical protein